MKEVLVVYFLCNSVIATAIIAITITIAMSVVVSNPPPATLETVEDGVVDGDGYVVVDAGELVVFETVESGGDELGYVWYGELDDEVVEITVLDDGVDVTGDVVGGKVMVVTTVLGGGEVDVIGVVGAVVVVVVGGEVVLGGGVDGGGVGVMFPRGNGFANG